MGDETTPAAPAAPTPAAPLRLTVEEFLEWKSLTRERGRVSAELKRLQARDSTIGAQLEDLCVRLLERLDLAGDMVLQVKRDGTVKVTEPKGPGDG